MTTITPEQMKESMERVEKATVGSIKNESVNPKTDFTRDILIVGIGDCGSNIANLAKSFEKGITAMSYNTSSRSSQALVDNEFIVAGQDGSGADRDFSKNVYRSGGNVSLMEGVSKVKADYIITANSLSGGTAGCGLNAAASFGNCNQAPNLVLGVLPAISEAKKRQFNALQWLKDLEKVLEIPTGNSDRKVVIGYMLFDNQLATNKMVNPGDTEIYDMINREAAKVPAILRGGSFTHSDGRSVDNRNLMKILIQGGLINIYESNEKIKLNQSLDSYLLSMVAASCQMEPSKAKGLAVMVRAPKDITDKMDFNIPEFTAKYGGEVERHVHVCNSEDGFSIALIVSGSELNMGRFQQIKRRYDEIDSASKAKVSVGNLLDGIDDPSNASNVGTKKQATTDIDYNF